MGHAGQEAGPSELRILDGILQLDPHGFRHEVLDVDALLVGPLLPFVKIMGTDQDGPSELFSLRFAPWPLGQGARNASFVALRALRLGEMFFHVV